MQIIRFSLRSIVLFSLIALFLASAAQAQPANQSGPANYVMIGQPAEGLTQKDLDFPAAYLPDVGAFTSAFSLYVSVIAKLPPANSPIALSGDVEILQSRDDGRTFASVDTVHMERSKTQDRWWFNTNDKGTLSFNGEIGSFTAPGDYVVRVRVPYTVYGAKVAIAYDFYSHVDDVAFYTAPCLEAGDVRLQFYVKTLFPVANQTALSFQIEGWENGFVTLAPTGDAYWPLYGTVHLSSPSEYDDTLVDTNREIGIELMGRFTGTSQHFYGPAASLGECSPIGGKG